MQTHSTALIVFAIVVACLAVGLFLCNMHLAGSGYSEMRKIKRREAEFAGQKLQMTELLNEGIELREKFKAFYGEDYALFVEPIDLSTARAVLALTEGDGTTAIQLMGEACYEMRAMLRPRPV